MDPRSGNERPSAMLAGVFVSAGFGRGLRGLRCLRGYSLALLGINHFYLNT